MRTAREETTRNWPWGPGGEMYLKINTLNSQYGIPEDFIYPWEDGTTPVGFYKEQNGMVDNASPFGVYDLIGNVSEWISNPVQYNNDIKKPENNKGRPILCNFLIILIFNLFLLSNIKILISLILSNTIKLINKDMKNNKTKKSYDGYNDMIKQDNINHILANINPKDNLLKLKVDLWIFV